MPSATVTHSQPKRYSTCPNGSRSASLTPRNHSTRSNAAAVGKQQRKRQAIVVDSNQSLFSTAELAGWSPVDDKVKDYLSEQVDGRLSKSYTQDQLVNSRGSISRAAIKRKPVPPLPTDEQPQDASLPSLPSVSIVSFPSDPSPQPPQHNSRPHSLPNSTRSTVVASPQSDLRTLVDEDEEWDIIGSDTESYERSPVKHSRPHVHVDDFVQDRAKAAREEAWCMISQTGCKRNIPCLRDECNDILYDHRALSNHLVLHDIGSRLSVYGEHIVYRCLTKDCRRAFLSQKDLDAHHIEGCGWKVQPTEHKSSFKTLVSRCAGKHLSTH